MEKTKGYKWDFAGVGGVTRVNITKGEDIAHLGELDQKLWTVLSCPVKGLELDEKTLAMLDIDNDGKIRVNEVIEAADWLTSVLKTNNLLFEQKGEINLNDINQETDNGKKIYASAKQILSNLGKEGDVLSIADTADSMAIFAKTRFNGDGVITADSTDDADLKAVIENCIKTIGSTIDRSGADGVNADQIEAFYANCADYDAWQKASTLPYGEKTAAALAAYQSIKTKVDDYFLRCKLSAFDSNAEEQLNVAPSQFEAISSKNLTECGSEIAEYPLSKINTKGTLTLKIDAINPAWQAAFGTLKSVVFDADFAKKDAIT